MLEQLGFIKYGIVKKKQNPTQRPQTFQTMSNRDKKSDDDSEKRNDSCSATKNATTANRSGSPMTTIYNLWWYEDCHYNELNENKIPSWSSSEPPSKRFLVGVIVEQDKTHCASSTSKRAGFCNPSFELTDCSQKSNCLFNATSSQSTPADRYRV